jgi:hypothetical protein
LNIHALVFAAQGIGHGRNPTATKRLGLSGQVHMDTASRLAAQEAPLERALTTFQGEAYAALHAWGETFPIDIRESQ